MSYLGGVNTGILRSGEGPGGGKSQSLQAAARSSCQSQKSAHQQITDAC
jgi:hypothetical protein